VLQNHRYRSDICRKIVIICYFYEYHNNCLATDMKMKSICNHAVLCHFSLRATLIRFGSLKICIQFRRVINSSYIVASQVTMLTPNIPKIGKFVRLYSMIMLTNWHGAINTAKMIRRKHSYMSLLYQFHIVRILYYYLSFIVYTSVSFFVFITCCFPSFPIFFSLKVRW
jgi:hypothetical protein